MAALVCDLCGGKLIMGSGGIATCESCGMEYSSDRMKEKVQEIKGTVRVDNSHMIANYLEMAQNAKSAGNNTEAEFYCNKIIEIEPTNYKAWMLKGEAAAWQSTLQNLRVDEGVAAFAKGINYAPAEEKDNQIELAKEQIKKISVAIISLRGERFAKWPDKEESAGFISDLTSILNTVVSFLAQTGIIISVAEIMAPVATQINQSVVKAYRNVVLPQFKSERYPWPDDNDLTKYIERLGYCTALVEKAIGICDNDDEEDIQRYENLIFLHKEALKACSYDWIYVNLSSQEQANWYRKKGFYPVISENRVYSKSKELNDESVAYRKRLISQYEGKIREIKSAIAAKEAAEKAERERIAKEAAQKRYDEYWAIHTEEKMALEAELKDLNYQISVLTASQDEQISALIKEISDIPERVIIDNLEERIKTLSEKKSTLGLFKNKEKKAIQEQIDQANTEKKSAEDRMSAAKDEIESRIANVKADFQKQILPLQDRADTISDELTKAR